MEAQAAAQAIAERLAAEAAARKADKELREVQQREASDPRENTTAFLQSFADHLARLSTAVSQGEGSSGNAGADSACNAMLDELVQLEQQTSHAAYYLPQYDLRQCLASIQGLRQRLEAVRAAADPKRKFTFRSKVARSKVAAVAAVDGAANDQAHETASSDAPAAPKAVAAAAEAPGKPVGISPANAAAAAATSSSSREGWPATASDQDLQLIAAGHGIMGRSHATICVTAEQLAGSDFVLVNLQHCQVHLRGVLPALRLQGLSHCSVTAGPVTGATFITGAEHCSFHLASYQVRIHHVTRSTFRLRTRSRPIIERCTDLLFGPLVEQQPLGTYTPPPRATAAAAAAAASDTSAVTNSSAAATLAPQDAGAAAAGCNAASAGTSSVQQQQQQVPDGTCSTAPASSSRAPAAGAGVQAPDDPVADLVGLLSATQLSEDVGQWRHVDDFDWVKATPSPHWRLMDTCAT